LLIHRHKLVEIRTRVKNGLQHLMLNRACRRSASCGAQAGQQALRELPLDGWAGVRREDLLELLAMSGRADRQAGPGGATGCREARQARLLMTQPGVGPITALAFAC
jgi:transposase